MEPNIDGLLPILLTTTQPGSDEPIRCVAVMDRLRAITFQHGEHAKYEVGETVTLYPVGESTDEPRKVTVVAANRNVDVVAFHTIGDDEFRVHPRAVNYPRLGMSYWSIGVDRNGRPLIKSGVFSAFKGAFAIGTTHAENGDSGSAIVDRQGLFLGIAVGKSLFTWPPNTIVGPMLNLEPLAHHCPYGWMVPTYSICCLLPRAENEMLDDEPPRKTKK